MAPRLHLWLFSVQLEVNGNSSSVKVADFFFFFLDLVVNILEAVAEVGFESGSAVLTKRNHFFMHK